MTPLVFLDTETDGVRPNRRVWEVAMIRRDDDGQREHSFFVDLDLRYSDPFGLKVLAADLVGGGFWDRHPSGRKMSGKPPLPGPTVPPWKSDDLSRACGVEPPSDDERHTALGDARWAMRWYDAMTGADQ